MLGVESHIQAVAWYSVSLGQQLDCLLVSTLSSDWGQPVDVPSVSQLCGDDTTPYAMHANTIRPWSYQRTIFELDLRISYACKKQALKSSGNLVVSST